MSHPPETSLELAAEIRKVLNIAIYDLESEEEWREIVHLMEAWVRVRELEAQIEEHEILCENGWSCYRRKELEDELATARKQLKEKGGTHGQAEAPSAAASANSEPGGA